MTPLVLKTMSLLGRGIAFMVAAWLVIPINDVAAKYLDGRGIPILMIVWGRCHHSQRNLHRVPGTLA